MKKRLIQGTAILTTAGLFCKLLGFFYRIFLSHIIGAEGMGLSLLIFHVHYLCFAFSVGGIQTALSRMIAASPGQNDNRRARSVFLAGLFCSVSTAFLLSVFLRHFSGFISLHILKEPRCSILLKILSLSLPLSAIHACTNGYFFARKETKVPAALLVGEQLIRISSSFLIYLFFTKKQLEPSPIIAVFGLVCSEFSAMALSLFFLTGGFHSRRISAASFRDCMVHLPEIFRLSFPITMNRVLLNLLHSTEAILIPWTLRRANMAANDALSTFGILSGMSMPVILFPTAIINSMAAILLPAVAEEQAVGNQKAILKLILNTVLYALLMGLSFWLLFLIFGNVLGDMMFHEKSAGNFIRTLSFICPFLYLNITLSSILNGLGKTFTCFLINFLDLSVRILFLLLLIPVFGVKGYLYGLLTGEILATIASSAALAHFLRKDFSQQIKKDVL